MFFWKQEWCVHTIAYTVIPAEHTLYWPSKKEKKKLAGKAESVGCGSNRCLVPTASVGARMLYANSGAALAILMPKVKYAGSHLYTDHRPCCNTLAFTKTMEPLWIRISVDAVYMSRARVYCVTGWTATQRNTKHANRPTGLHCAHAFMEIRADIREHFRLHASEKAI